MERNPGNRRPSREAACRGARLGRTTGCPGVRFDERSVWHRHTRFFALPGRARFSNQFPRVALRSTRGRGMSAPPGRRTARERKAIRQEIVPNAPYLRANRDRSDIAPCSLSGFIMEDVFPLGSRRHARMPTRPDADTVPLFHRAHRETPHELAGDDDAEDNDGQGNQCPCRHYLTPRSLVPT